MAKTFNKGNTATSDNRNSPKPGNELIDELAGLEPLAYEQRREAAARQTRRPCDRARQVRQGKAQGCQESQGIARGNARPGGLRHP